MSVPKKAKPLDAAAFLSGAAHIEAVRGITNWGANYVFNSGALQGDILTIADTFKDFSTVAGYATDAEVSAVSGYITSGNVSYDTSHAMPSGGFYIKAGDDATGVYHVYVNGNDSSSGMLMVIPV